MRLTRECYMRDINFKIEQSGPYTIITNDTPFKADIHIYNPDIEEDISLSMEPYSFYNIESRIDLDKVVLWFEV